LNSFPARFVSSACTSPPAAAVAASRPQQRIDAQVKSTHLLLR